MNIDDKITNLQSMAYASQLSAETFDVGNMKFVSRGLEDYVLPEENEYFFGYKSHLQWDDGEEVEKRKPTPENPMMVLDLGCGRGKFVHEMQERYGDIVRCFGVNLDILEPLCMNRSNLIIGDFKGDASDDDIYILDMLPKNTFDFITEIYSGPDPGKYTELLLRKVYRLLAPGGEARLMISSIDQLNSDKLPEEMVVEPCFIVKEHNLTINGVPEPEMPSGIAICNFVIVRKPK